MLISLYLALNGVVVHWLMRKRKRHEQVRIGNMIYGSLSAVCTI
jgi:hypothetical protein